MFAFIEEITPRTVWGGLAFSVVAVLLFLHSLQLGSVFMIAASLVLLFFRAIDTAVMLIGMAWNHANTGTIWERTRK